MKQYKFINTALALAASLVLAASCQEEQSPVATAVQTKETSIVFAAQNPEPQVINVFADGEWVADVSEDWIEINPMKGDKNTEVTVTVLSDNVDANGKLKAPRQAVLTFMGNSEIRKGVVNVTQKGDTYIDSDEYTVSEAVLLEEATKAKIVGSTVLATTAGGFVITDGTTNMYVEGAREVAPGDAISLNGECKMIGGFPAFVADEAQVLSSSEVEHGDPVVVDEAISAEMLSKVQYMKVNATIVGEFIRIAGQNSGIVLDAPESLEISKVNVHKVELLGYYVGKISGKYAFAITSLKDNGVDETVGVDLPYKDDFSWMAPFIADANAKLADANHISDCVGSVTSSSDGAANIYTTLVNNNILLLDELRKRGYTDLNPGQKTIYLQDAYLKYGATSKQSGLVLPLFKISGEQDLVVSFKWCAQMQGSGAIDKTEMVIEISGPGTIVTSSGTPDAKISDPVKHNQKTGEMFWNEASFTIKGATVATSISFHPLQFGSEEAPVSSTYRYYLDDLEVMLAADAIKTNIQVEGLDSDLITFEGTPAAPKSFQVVSDADYSVTTGAKWLTIENGQGIAGVTNTVTVTCEPSELSTIRQAVIAIKSGVSVRNIQVVQSAAGGQLDDLISVAASKSTSALLGEGDSFDVAVQANVDYEVELSDSWISEVEAPSTRALVEKTVHSFTLAPNLTGATRSGYIRFYNEDKNIEAYVMIRQENFEPRIDVIVSSQTRFIPAAGMTLPVRIESNVDFTATSEEITLPVSEAVAGNYDLSVQVKANTGLTRDAKVTFYNAKYDFTYVYAIEQHGSDVIFADDFSWLQPVIDAAKSSTPGEYDTVGSKNLGANAPNLYSTEALNDIFVPLRDKMGYVIPGKADGANNVVYVQECYLKMGKTSSKSQTSLTLPSINAGGKDYVLSMDWARMVQGSGAIDNYTLTWVIVGNGTFENGTKYSDPFETPQGLGEIFWTKISAVVKGADADTRITVVATDLLNKETGAINYKASGGRRMFIDNIVAKVIE